LEGFIPDPEPTRNHVESYPDMTFNFLNKGQSKFEELLIRNEKPISDPDLEAQKVPDLTESRSLILVIRITSPLTNVRPWVPLGFLLHLLVLLRFAPL